MQLKNRKKVIAWATILSIFGLVLAGSFAEAASVDPILIQGNATCTQLIAGTQELKVEPVADGTFTDGTLTVTIDVYNTAQGPVFDFTANMGVDGVFVKGGPNGNLYLYNPEVIADTILHAPINPANDMYFGLSHISFCYGVELPTNTPTSTDTSTETATSTATGTATNTPTNTPTPGEATGYLEICKTSDPEGPVTGTFTFMVAGQTFTVPAGACTAPIQLPAGQVTITEQSRAGIVLTEISTIPSDRLVSSDLNTGTAVVNIVPGDVSTETVVFFRNKNLENGHLKICKIAGTGVTLETPFTFVVNGTSTHTVPAGYCVFDGLFPVGTQVTVQEQWQVGYQLTDIAADPSGRLVSADLATGQGIVTIGSGVTVIYFTNQATMFTHTPTITLTSTSTGTPTNTQTPTPTDTPTAVPTDTPTFTPTSTPTPVTFQGCTPGYWRQAQHLDSWAATGYSPNQTLESVFDIPDSYGLDNFTLLQALSFQGGSGTSGAARILLRAAVAALLNASHPDVDYQITTAQVITRVNNALATEDRARMLTVAERLDLLNNMGCPLN